jgi:hypothetical protein
MKKIHGIKITTGTILAATLLTTFAQLSGAHADVLCHISDPRDPTLNVRSSPGGTVVSSLRNEELVRVFKTQADATGRLWANIGERSANNRRGYDEDWVLRDSLRCVNTDRFPRERISVTALQSVGIVPQDAFRTQKMPISCNEVPNGWGLTISDELYQSYRRRGFSRQALCLALGGSHVLFDPATGRRLPLYQIPGDISGLRPLWLSDCYRQIQVLPNQGFQQYLIYWRPTGCIIRYHPSTGLPITKPELVKMVSGGEAGGEVDEDNRSSTVSQSRLRSLVNGQ